MLPTPAKEAQTKTSPAALFSITHGRHPCWGTVTPQVTTLEDPLAPLSAQHHTPQPRPGKGRYNGPYTAGGAQAREGCDGIDSWGRRGERERSDDIFLYSLFLEILFGETTRMNAKKFSPSGGWPYQEHLCMYGSLTVAFLSRDVQCLSSKLCPSASGSVPGGEPVPRDTHITCSLSTRYVCGVLLFPVVHHVCEREKMVSMHATTYGHDHGVLFDDNVGFCDVSGAPSSPRQDSRAIFWSNRRHRIESRSFFASPCYSIPILQTAATYHEAVIEAEWEKKTPAGFYTYK